jgi:hypothetical protein
VASNDHLSLSPNTVRVIVLEDMAGCVDAHALCHWYVYESSRLFPDVMMITEPGTSDRYSIPAHQPSSCYPQCHADSTWWVYSSFPLCQELFQPPSVGVVIGFVISYRFTCAYDQYWRGRTAWSNVAKNTTTLSRLIWFHVPLRLSPKTQQEPTKPVEPLRGKEEVETVMGEKWIALEMLEG